MLKFLLIGIFTLSVACTDKKKKSAPAAPPPAENSNANENTNSSPTIDIEAELQKRIENLEGQLSSQNAVIADQKSKIEVQSQTILEQQLEANRSQNNNDAEPESKTDNHENENTNAAETPTAPSVEGQWSTGCYKFNTLFFAKVDLTIGPTTMMVTRNFYEDNCLTSTQTLVTEMEYTVIPRENSRTHGIDFKIRSHNLTPLSQIYVDAWNADGEAGYTDWALGAPKSVAGTQNTHEGYVEYRIGDTLYDVITVLPEQEQLQFSDPGMLRLGTSETARPTATSVLAVFQIVK